MVAVTPESSLRRDQAPRLRLLWAGLLALHVVVAVVLLFDPSLRSAEYATRSDAARFYDLAVEDGTPYVDFEVEYPPVTLLASRALALGSFDTFIAGVVLVSLACDLGIAFLLRRTWGLHAGVAYLVLAAPMVPVGLTRLDWLPTLLAVAALAASLHGRQRAAGFTLAVGAFAKLWPAALAGILFARGRRAAVAAFCVTGVLGLGAWIAVTDVDAVRQVVSYRGAEGWHVESLPGTLVAAFTDAAVRFESGAWRIGHPPAALGPILTLGGLAALTAVTVRLRRTASARPPEDDGGDPALAMVGIVMVTATLLSPQFLVWLLPWGAIAYARGNRRATACLLTAVLATVVAGAVWSAEASGTTGAQLAYWVRNLALVAVVVTAARDIGARVTRGPSPLPPAPGAAPVIPAPSGRSADAVPASPPAPAAPAAP